MPHSIHFLCQFTILDIKTNFNHWVIKLLFPVLFTCEWNVFPLGVDSLLQCHQQGWEDQKHEQEDLPWPANGKSQGSRNWRSWEIVKLLQSTRKSVQDCGSHALSVALFSIDEEIIHANVYRVQDINKQCKKLNYIV